MILQIKNIKNTFITTFSYTFKGSNVTAVLLFAQLIIKNRKIVNFHPSYETERF